MRKISRILGRFVSSISAEIKRGTVLQKLSNGQEVNRYFPDVTQRIYEENRHRSVAKRIGKWSQKFLTELTTALLTLVKRSPRFAWILKVSNVESITCLNAVQTLLTKTRMINV